MPPAITAGFTTEKAAAIGVIIAEIARSGRCELYINAIAGKPVAPAYAKQRSSLAKSLGLGRKAAVVKAEPEVALEPEPEAPKKRSRAKTAA